MTAQAAASEGDHWLRCGGYERHPGEQPDLGVDGLDQGVGQVVFGRGKDPGPRLDDALLELHERRDPGPAGSVDPVVAGLGGRFLGQLEYQA